MGHPTCIIEGLACWLTLCILEKIMCNSTNSVQISFIETLQLIVFSWTIWWCYWQNVLMINEKNNFLTVSWLSGLLSAEIFISTGEWGVQMPPLTSENSYFLRSGPQGATLVMSRCQCSVCVCVLLERLMNRSDIIQYTGMTLFKCCFNTSFIAKIVINTQVFIKFWRKINVQKFCRPLSPNKKSCLIC